MLGQLFKNLECSSSDKNRFANIFAARQSYFVFLWHQITVSDSWICLPNLVKPQVLQEKFCTENTINFTDYKSNFPEHTLWNQH